MPLRHRPRLFAGAAALAVALLLPQNGSRAAPPAGDPARSLQGIERDLDLGKRNQQALEERAQRLAEEMAWLRAQLVDLADETARREQDVADIDTQIVRLSAEEREKSESLGRQRAQMATLLGALERLSRVPPEAAMVRPGTPVDTLRSALLLRQTIPALREGAAQLTATLEQLALVRQQLEDDRAKATAARQNLQVRHQQLAALVARREALAAQTDSDRQAAEQRIARLNAQAGDLRQLMDRIEAERRTAAAAAEKREAERREAEARLAAAREAERKEAERKEAERKDAERKEAAQKEAQSKEAERKAAQQSETVASRPPESPPSPAARLPNGLRLPVGGPITVHYGGRDSQGADARGVTIASHPGTAVVSPAAGTVMYAGPFRSFGLILIVEHGNGYHSLLAGLGRIDVTVGRHVTAGEPLGILPAAAGDGGGGRDLYFELRRHGQPVDPERGFAEKQGKGQG